MNRCHRCDAEIDELQMPWCDECYDLRHLPLPLPAVTKTASHLGFWIGAVMIGVLTEAGGILAGWMTGLLW